MILFQYGIFSPYAEPAVTQGKRRKEQKIQRGGGEKPAEYNHGKRAFYLAARRIAAQRKGQKS